jgi:hypothetical protein
MNNIPYGSILLCIDGSQTEFVIQGYLYVAIHRNSVYMNDGVVIIGEDGKERHLFTRRFKIVVEP